MSSQKDLSVRPRSMSAKVVPANRSRPMSGMTTNTIKLSSKNIKTQLIASIYQSKQKSPSRKNLLANTIIYQGASTEQLPKPKKMPMYYGPNRSKEQLYQQNLQLKKEINKINQQYAIIKSKIMTKSKKIITKQKQLDMQFEKQIYWAGSKTHMITGIKSQYQKLRKQHAQQNRKLEQLKIQLMQSRLPQYKIYAQSVQNQNKRLTQKLKKFINSQNELFQRLQPDRQVSMALTAQNELNCINLQQKLTNIDIQLRNAKQNIIDKEKKIQFLQKLIIQKDNKQFHMGRKIKKLQFSKTQLQQLLQQHKNYNHECERQNKILIQNMKAQHQQTVSNQKIKYQSQIQEKQKKIKQYQDQNKSLQMTINKLRMSSSVVNNSNSQNDLRKSSISNVRRRNTINNSNAQEINTQNQNKKLDNFQSIKSKDLEDSDQNIGIDNDVKKERIVQRADKKHSDNSKKLRRVQADQVKQIGQILKYRLMNQRIPSQQIRNYFSYKNQSSQFIINESASIKHTDNYSRDSEIGMNQSKGLVSIPLSNNKNAWHEKYINTQECSKILQSQPFNLAVTQAHLLSRYLIEDYHQQFVYYDPGNQNSRDVVKSIMKSVVGQYELASQEIVSRSEQFMSKYQTNLQSALKTYYPNGKVPKNKLFDTMNGLGVKIDPDVAEFIAAKAINNSSKIDEIEYKYLFIKQINKQSNQK